MAATWLMQKIGPSTRKIRINAEIAQRGESLGRISAGLTADLIVLDQHRLLDLTVFERYRSEMPVVMRAGRFLRNQLTRSSTVKPGLAHPIKYALSAPAVQVIPLAGTLVQMLFSLRLVFGLLTLVAIVRQLTIHLQMGFSVVNFFSYFTNLANAFAAVVLLFGAFHLAAKRGAPSDQVRAASVVNMVVVGVVFAVLLRNVDLGSLLPWVNVLLHYVMPCVVVIDWLLQPPLSQRGARQLMLIMIFPALYLAYVLIRGSSIGWYPYPFLNPANVGGYAGVAVYVVGIAATFLIAGRLLLALGNRRLRA